MTQPILHQMPNFDAVTKQTFTFTYLGAEMTTTNQLSIREDKTNSQPVYEKIQDSLDKNHILPAKTLNNGTAYLAKVRVKTTSGWSEWSPEIKYTCFATPKIIFDTIDQKQFIYTNDVLMSAVYTQAQGEPVKSYQYTLYDQRHVVVTRYPVRVPQADSLTRFSERVKNIRKGKLYYIGLKVITVHGIVYEQLQEFTAQYVAPSVSGVIQPTLSKSEGQVVINLFLKQMLGTSARAYIPKRENDNDDQYSYWKNDYVIVPKSNPLMYTKLAMAKASNWVAKLWVMNVQDGLFLDFSKAFGEGTHVKFYKRGDYITCEKSFGKITSRTRSNKIPNLGLRPFYLYIRVLEYRIEIFIEPDFTYTGDDPDASKTDEEKRDYLKIAEETQRVIDAANAKIISAKQRLQDKHDQHWQQYIGKVDAAISNGRAGVLNHDELVDRIMEIDDEYWNYFNYDERVKYYQVLFQAERESEEHYEIYRQEYIARMNETIQEMLRGKLTLDAGRTKLREYSTVYSFMLREVVNFEDTTLDLPHIQLAYDQYVDKYKFK